MYKSKIQKSSRIIFFFSFFLLTHIFANAQSLPVAAPNSVGMNSEKLDQIDGLVEQAITEKKMPGAVILVGHKGKIVYRKAFGNRALVPQREKMTVDTIFDVASLTKPIATATSIMILVEQGKIRLNDTIGKFIPEIEDENAKQITILQLLTHTSGFRPGFNLGEKWTGRDGMLAALKKEKLRNPPGTSFVYSDIGFIVLAEIIRIVMSSDIYLFSKNNIYPGLQMKYTQFIPCFRLNGDYRIDGVEPNSDDHCYIISVSSADRSKIAPTENIKGQNSYLGAKFEGDEKTGNEILRGQVHDPTSYRMGGVAGHAGLFSTADDLARYCQMLLNGGVLDGKRILSAQTVAKMTSPVVISETGETRGLGWDINTSFSSNRGELFPLGSFGHTGFTGTSVWIDRVSQTFVIFLSNRVHPDGKGNVTDVRAKIATVVASAIEDTPIEKFKEAEAQYFAEIAPQIEKFKVQISNAKPLSNEQPTTNNQQRTTDKTVLNGIDVLEKNNFKELEGLRIGLVTNQTGRNLNGKLTIDVLHEAQNVKLVALFSPEHGIRGELDQEKITDSKDEKTGLPIYSLYGETRRPKPEQLQDLDAIVFDIQDIGTRFYTYISTLKNVLEESAKAKKPVFVLDRVNPLGGERIEGALADADKLSFVAAHPIPVRHGMTIGELAGMFNAEDKIGADLRVIKMENWRRDMLFDQTNQIWVNPSPNMRSLTQAMLYPGIGLLETTNLSVGRGTDTPFELIGAPWLDGQRLAAHLNEKNLKGVRFVPVRFTANASVFKGENSGGINIIITNREIFEPVETGIEIALALREIFPNEWQFEKYNRLLANDRIFTSVRQKTPANEIKENFNLIAAEFRKRRASFLLYK